jgi:hypothetical protein
MTKETMIAAAIGIVCLTAGSCLALAQEQAPAGGGEMEKPPMSFFVTSVGLPGGANMHGLAGADAHCQDLAVNATGRRRPLWHAYLSTQERPGEPALNARDRIGEGPWYNAAGVMIARNVEKLHSPDNNINKTTTLNEFGQLTPGDDAARDDRDASWAYVQTHPYSIRHEILTGT